MDSTSEVECSSCSTAAPQPHGPQLGTGSQEEHHIQLKGQGGFQEVKVTEPNLEAGQSTWLTPFFFSPETMGPCDHQQPDSGPQGTMQCPFTSNSKLNNRRRWQWNSVEIKRLSPHTCAQPVSVANNEGKHRWNKSEGMKGAQGRGSYLLHGTRGASNSKEEFDVWDGEHRSDWKRSTPCYDAALRSLWWKARNSETHLL